MARKCHTTKEQRVAWLQENKVLWEKKDTNDLDFLKDLALKMRSAGLYAPATQLDEISYRLHPLLLAAGKKPRVFDSTLSN